MSDDTRAPAGGTTGMNGEHYKGGMFLPSTTLPKRGSTGKRGPKAPRRHEISMFEYEPAPTETAYALYATFKHVWAFAWVEGQRQPVGLHETFDWERHDATGQYKLEAQRALDLWLAGERWAERQ